MLQKIVIPILALLGALFGLYMVMQSQNHPPVPRIMFPPATSPYPHAIAGAGIIEASSLNISIGTPFNEIIRKVYVIEGDHVKAGDPLIELDLRNFTALLEVAKANLAFAQKSFEDKRQQYSFYQRVKNRKAVSEQAYEESMYGMLEALENIRIGEANILEAQTNIDRSIIKAPIDGQILQVNCHVGEIAPVIPFISPQSTWATAANGTLILMGAVTPLQIRIDVDEDDAWRYEPGSNAMGFVRGNRNIAIPLRFVRVEPYIIPKSSFTGETVERVDTRVLQVLYQFDRGNFPVYAGQILDIFIKSRPITDFIHSHPLLEKSEE